jgi:transcriptional regulator with XRE-family HTH domain
MLNERLKNLRLAKGLTLQQVGDAFSISKVSVSTWESGKTNPDRKRLEKIADLYGTSVQYLVTGVEDESFSNSTSEKVPFWQWEEVRLGVATPNKNSWVKPIHCRPSKSAFATRYSATSLLGWQAPGIPAGSILIIDPEVQSGNGDYLLVQKAAGELLIAKQSITPENKQLLLRVDSLNFKPISPTIYKTVGTVLEWQMSGKLK